MKHKITVGDIYGLYNSEIEHWSLLQVIEQTTDQGFVLIELLPFLKEPPKEQDTTNIQPLLKIHHRWTGGYFYTFIKEEFIPEQVIFITNKTPILTWEILQTDRDNYKTEAWEENVPQRVYQFYWHQLPKAVTKAYKEKVFSLKTTSYVSTHAVIDAEHGAEILPVIQENPAIVELKCTGPIPYVTTLLEQKPILSTLTWMEHQQTSLDFRKSQLLSLVSDVTGLKELQLNSTLKHLELVGDFSQLEDLHISHSKEGAFLGLTLYREQELILPNFHLPHLKKLNLKANQIDLQQVAQYYPQLLELNFWGNPGLLYNIAALTQLQQLEHFFFNDLFGYAAADFPTKAQLPSVTSIYVTSIPKAVGQYLKKEFKELPHLDVSKLRNEKWLAENLNNPFRSWDGRFCIQKTDAKKAFTAYKKLHAALAKTTEKATCTQLFQDFLLVFNTMSNKKSDLATMEREEVTQVCLDLLDQTPLNDKELYDILEGTIDF